MRASIEALKGAGIQTVVLLSSFSVQGDIRAIQPSDFIAFGHAQVEINLQDVFGEEGYVALRPAFFASNSMWWKGGVLEGEVKSAYPEAKFDYIAPEDMGRVAGTFLAKGLPEKNFVYLAGPEMLSIRDAVGVIAKALGKEVKVTKVDEQEELQFMLRVTKIPEPVAKNVLRGLREQEESGGFFGKPGYEEACGNVQKYTGKPSLRFHEWVDLNKDKFLA
jgi:uncharacterized protein YbjT (DUF2867 family)